MRHVLALALAGVLAAFSSAQEDELQQKLQKMLAKDFVRNADWVLDYDEARRAARESGRLIFAYFTRSYAPWAPTDALEGGTLDTPEFKEFAKHHVMFLHVTTHLPNRPHDNLLETVGGRIFFPSFFVLDAEGEVVGRHTGDRSVPGFVATMREAAEFVDLRAKAAAGDRRAAVALLLARARMGRLTAAALEAEMAKHELDAAQRKVYRGVLADFMLEDVQRTAVGRAFLEMEKDDLVPADAAKRSFFYAQIFPYGAQTGDVALMERCLGELEAAWGQEPAHEATLAGLRKQIEQAKARRREAADQEKR